MSWFDKCSRVPWQPPNIVFKVVWPILYALYGLLMYLERNNKSNFNILLVGLVMNFGWVPLYAFNTRAALLLLTGMIYVGVKTIMALKGSRVLIFSPYLAWLCFAWTLNAYLAVTC
jgi:benzodiazapine receptor